MALVEFRVETNIFSSHFLVSIKSVGIIVLGVQIHLTSLYSSCSFQITAFTRTDGHGKIDSASDPDQEYIYLMGWETISYTWYILFPEYNIPFVYKEY